MNVKPTKSNVNRSGQIVAAQIVKKGDLAREWNQFMENLSALGLSPDQSDQVRKLVENSWLETPATPGIYVTVRMDSDDAKVRMVPVTLVEDLNKR